MSTKKIYFILLVLIVILIFTSAAICGNCTNAAAVSTTQTSTGSDQNTSSSVSSGGSPTSSSEQGSSSTHAGNPSSTSQEATTSTSSSEAGSPTISLVVYEGPNYSPADNIYYFRVEATVTGSPKPVVTWSKDDSGSAWGNKKAQVSLNPGQTYTLVASAKNSVGTASASIVLTAPGTVSSSSSSSSSSSIPVNHAPDVADINVSGTLYADTVYAVSAAASDSDGDTLTYAWSSTGGLWTDPNINPAQWRTPAAAGNYTLTLTVNDGHGGITVRTKDVTVVLLSLINLSVPAVYSEGGYIENGGITNAGGCVFAGDTGANKYARGYMSYNITSLAGATIDTATFTFILKQVYGNPTEHAGSTMSLQIVDYGASPISQASLLLPGTPIYNAAAPIFSFSGPALKTQLQSAINAGKQRFQLCVGFTAPNFDSDGVWDGWEYDQTGITLNIKYLPAH